MENLSRTMAATEAPLDMRTKEHPVTLGRTGTATRTTMSWPLITRMHPMKAFAAPTATLSAIGVCGAR